MSDPRDPLAGQWGQMSPLEKIDWMVDTEGFAVEPVLPDATTDPPQPAYAYTIGLPGPRGVPGGGGVRAHSGRSPRSARSRR